MKKRLLLVTWIVLPFFSLFNLANAQVFPDSDTLLSYQVEMLTWEEVNHILPKYSTFKVVDVETGKSFMVQRRAGNYHADVQPLRHQDTKMMKEIYNGEWSWKRRAILVVVEDEWIAASMHGMPHGAGSLKNGFPGHFCIHFYGSKTHKSNDEDLSHHLMILKAAGKLEEFVREADASQVVNTFFAGLKQHDETIVKSVIIPGQKVKWQQVWDEMNNVSLVFFSISADNETDFYLEVPIKYEWIHKDLSLIHI